MMHVIAEARRSAGRYVNQKAQRAKYTQLCMFEEKRKKKKNPSEEQLFQAVEE